MSLLGIMIGSYFTLKVNRRHEIISKRIEIKLNLYNQLTSVLAEMIDDALLFEVESLTYGITIKVLLEKYNIFLRKLSFYYAKILNLNRQYIFFLEENSAIYWLGEVILMALNDTTIEGMNKSIKLIKDALEDSEVEIIKELLDDVYPKKKIRKMCMKQKKSERFLRKENKI